MNKLLSIKNITKDFSGGRALDNVSFSVEKGEIYGLIGGNGAGKTTLMNIISGYYPYGSYEGEFYLNGKPCHFYSTKDSEKNKIAIIHQELSLVQEMSIADNIFLGNEQGNIFFVDRKKTKEETKRILELVGLDESPDTLIKDIGAGKQQLVEIAKALSKDADILILDEPTSSLGEEHFKKLASLMFQLKAQGKTMIIISHKLNEIIAVSDQITVLRDGKTIETFDNTNHDVDEKQIIKAMAGHDIEDLYPQRKNVVSDEVVLKLEHYEVKSLRRKGELSLKDINLKIHKGEVVGLYGLMASGRSKLVKSLFGHLNGLKASGSVEIDGKKVNLQTPKEAIQAGLAYVSEDRMNVGLAQERSIKENMTLVGLDKITQNGLLDKVKEKEIAKENLQQFHIKANSYDQEVKELSGGNQQKVLLSEWFYMNPKVIILDEPTKGIDVGAKYEIYHLINQYVKTNGAVLMISSDLSEIFGTCDRMYILSEGKVTGELTKEEFSNEEVMRLILKEEES